MKKNSKRVMQIQREKLGLSRQQFAYFLSEKNDSVSKESVYSYETYNKNNFAFPPIKIFLRLLLKMAIKEIHFSREEVKEFLNEINSMNKQ